jgi:metal-sulfur cluster biosynthetic enzyme
VVDPEIGVNVVDLGLVYNVDVQGHSVRIAMTMTTPACPLHEYISERNSHAWPDGAFTPRTPA